MARSEEALLPRATKSGFKMILTRTVCTLRFCRQEISDAIKTTLSRNLCPQSSAAANPPFFLRGPLATLPLPRPRPLPLPLPLPGPPPPELRQSLAKCPDAPHLKHLFPPAPLLCNPPPCLPPEKLLEKPMLSIPDAFLRRLLGTAPA